MQSPAYERKLQALRSAILAAEGAPLSIEQELSAVLEEGGPKLSTDLLLSLSDDADAGAMYALVHAAEALDANPYRVHISGALSVLPQLSRTAPNWALEIIRRVMNAKASLVELETQLQSASEPIKAAARRICELNEAIEPDHMPRTDKARIARAAS